MDWVAGVLELTGLYIVGNKNRWGFIINICCGLCWISYVLYSRSTYGLLIVVVPALCINTRNFIRWTREGSSFVSGGSEIPPKDQSAREATREPRRYIGKGL